MEEKKRSTGVTVIGVLMIIFAVLGIFAGLIGLFSIAMIDMAATSPQMQEALSKPEMQEGLKTFQEQGGYIKFSSTLVSVLSILAIFIGTNILKLRESWRKIAIYYASFLIVYWIGELIFVPAMRPQAIMGFPFFSIAVLIVLTRPAIKGQFA